MIEVSNGGQWEGTSTHNFTAKDTEASMRDIDHSGVSETSGPLPAFPEQYMHFSYQECNNFEPQLPSGIANIWLVEELFFLLPCWSAQSVPY